MASFNFGYSSSNLIPYQRVSTVTQRGYASGSGRPTTYQEQETNINNLVKPKTGGTKALRDANPEIDFDTNWNEIERDPTDWFNPYSEPEYGLPDEYPFQDFNYGP